MYHTKNTTTNHYYHLLYVTAAKRGGTAQSQRQVNDRKKCEIHRSVLGEKQFSLIFNMRWRISMGYKPLKNYNFRYGFCV